MVDLHSFIPAPAASSFFEIQRHFLERTLDLEAMRNLLLAVSIAVGVILLLMLIRLFRPQKPYAPQDWVMEQGAIRDILTEALSQRAKMELHFASEGEGRRPALRCSAMRVDDKTLLLEASGLTTLSHQWEGRRTDCFFMVRHKDNYVFYAFTTTIVAITEKKDYCLISVALPEKLETRQKRSYLRITPPEEYMLGAAIWRGPDMPDDSVRDDLALWPEPSRIWLPGTREDFIIRDISSGGVRVQIPRHMLTEEMEYTHISTNFLMMLDLWEPDKASRLRFWLLCRMQNPVLDFETKGLDVGAQFLAWAKPAGQGGSALVWLKLASSGEVEPLGNWIMRRHLEFFRESEQAVGFGQRQPA